MIRTEYENIVVTDHKWAWESAGVLNIDFKLLGSYVRADLQSGYLTNKIPTVTIFTMNSRILIISVNVHTPFSLLS